MLGVPVGGMLSAVNVGSRGGVAEGIAVAVDMAAVRVCSIVSVGLASSSWLSSGAKATIKIVKIARLIASRINGPISFLLRLFMAHASSDKITA